MRTSRFFLSLDTMPLAKKTNDAAYAEEPNNVVAKSACNIEVNVGPLPMRPRNREILGNLFPDLRRG